MKDPVEAIKNVGHLLDVWMPLKIKHDKTPGVSIGITYKESLLYKKGFGFSDLENKTRAHENTLYHIASISKMFTAIAILQLVEAEKLQLDDPVLKYIPWFKAKTKTTDSKYITIRHLLSHLSGIFRDGDTAHWENGNFPKNLSRSFSSKSLILETLSKFKYSNYGYAILGEIIQTITKGAYETYVKNNILIPLGMHSTFPDYSREIGNVSIATGYGKKFPDENRQTFEHFQTHAYAPATGFLSNVTDLAHFLPLFSSQYREKTPILSRNLIKEMLRPHGKTTDSEEYGLGVDVVEISKRSIVGHSGGFQGFLTRVLVDEKNGFGVIVLSNSLHASTAYEVASGILKSIYAFLDNKKVYSGKREQELEKYEGTYRTIWGDRTVAQIGNTLVTFSPRSNCPLFPLETFRATDKKHHFVFETENVFEIVSEEVEFSDFRNNTAQVLRIGPLSARKVE